MKFKLHLLALCALFSTQVVFSEGEEAEVAVEAPKKELSLDEQRKEHFNTAFANRTTKHVDDLKAAINVRSTGETDPNKIWGDFSIAPDYRTNRAKDSFVKDMKNRIANAFKRERSTAGRERVMDVQFTDAEMAKMKALGSDSRLDDILKTYADHIKTVYEKQIKAIDASYAKADKTQNKNIEKAKGKIADAEKDIQDIYNDIDTNRKIDRSIRTELGNIAASRTVGEDDIINALTTRINKLGITPERQAELDKFFSYAKTPEEREYVQLKKIINKVVADKEKIAKNRATINENQAALNDSNNRKIEEYNRTFRNIVTRLDDGMNRLKDNFTQGSPSRGFVNPFAEQYFI